MAITFARTGYTYGTTSFTAPTPSGTGGRLIVAAMYRGVTVTPATPANWSTPIDSPGTADQAIPRVWLATTASPNMAFNGTGTGEVGMYTFRVDDADVAGSFGSGNLHSATFGTGPINLPDVTSAPDGAALGWTGMHNGGSTTAYSLGWTEHYDGDIGASGWWAQDVAVVSLDGVTPGGGTFDTGTVTFAAGEYTEHVYVVTATGGGPAGGGLVSRRPRSLKGLTLRH